MTSSQRTTRFVFLYLHGMSTVTIVDKEIAMFGHHLHRRMVALHQKHRQPFSYDYHALLYHHLVEESEELRMRAHRAYNSIWDTIKEVVLTRFPVAMAYWTEPQLRREAHRSIKRILGELSEHYARNEQEDVRVILVGYTSGSLVSSLALGEIYHETGSLLPEGDATNMVLHALLTLGCPLPW